MIHLVIDELSYFSPLCIIQAVVEVSNRIDDDRRARVDCFNMLIND